MIYHHQQLAGGRFKELDFFSQMANIGSEVERAIAWQGKNQQYSRLAGERALELLDLAIQDDKNKARLRELTRLREALIDYFWFDNEFGSSDKLWHDYFLSFNYAARLGA